MNFPRPTPSLIYRLLVTAISLPILVVVLFVLRGETDATGRPLLMIVAALFAAVAAAVWFRHIVAVYVQMVVLPILAGVYLFELARTDPLDQVLHIERRWGIVKARKAAGQPVSIEHSPQNFIDTKSLLTLADGSQVLPLSGVANVHTIMCREGPRPVAEYVADEHGYNNPKGLWGTPIDLVFIGDSMTYGACLPERDHFIGQIRARYPALLNLSNGGIGPLVYLAMMREFLPVIRPKYVFYMYDENNDVYFVKVAGEGDLIQEYQHPVLRKYFDVDDFSQRLLERRNEVHTALKQLVDNTIDGALKERTFGKSIVKVLGLSLTRAGLRPPSGGPATPLAPPRVQLQSGTSVASRGTQLPRDEWLDADILAPRADLRLAGFGRDDYSSRWRMAQQVGPAQLPEAAAPDYLEVFKIVFAKTLRVANEAGARLVFVNIPAQLAICDNDDHPWKRKLLDFVAESGVDMVDLEKDFRNATIRMGREQMFAVPPCGGHFSELGYKVIGDRLLQYLKLKEALSSPAPAAPAEGWSYRRQQTPGVVSHSDQLIYTGTYLGEPELEAARRGDAERWRRSRPNAISRALAGTTDWVLARFATRRVFSHQQSYNSDADVERVIKTDGSMVIDRDGSGIMGYSWQPKAVTSVVRVRVAVPAWSKAENSIVAALFSDGLPEPLALARRRLRPSRAGTALLDVEIATRDGRPVNLSVRVAPGKPGTVYLNSNTTPPIANLSKPTLTIEEYAPFWR